jgi:hypothetical protein
VVRLSNEDPARRERALERQVARHAIDVDLLTGELLRDDGESPAKPESRSEITEWSAKSRSRMIRTLAELDWGPVTRSALGVPAMTTLTYPGDWVPVAADGRMVKRHLLRFFKRYERAWGTPWVGPWKLEFQHRGAPHFHLWGLIPSGRAGDLRSVTNVRRRKAVGDGMRYHQWVSAVWADIVRHPDPEERAKHLLAGTGVDIPEGLKCVDPRRMAMYFSKHGSYSAKEYQHLVPEEWQQPGKGPGRFWGYRGLEKLVAEVEISQQEYYQAARMLRRLSARTKIWDPVMNAGQGGERWVKAVRRAWVWRTPGGVPVPKDQEVQGVAGLAYVAHAAVRGQRVMYAPDSDGGQQASDAPDLTGTAEERIRAMARQRYEQLQAPGHVATGALPVMIPAGVQVSRSRRRRATRPVRRFARSSGYLVVTDGPATAMLLVQLLGEPQ